MFQSIQVKPLVGKWADDARRDIPIEYLEEFVPNQEEWANRQKAADSWKQMGVALKLYPEGDRQVDQLRKVQEFIARTPPQQRCPCAHGVPVEKSEDHYSRCDAKFGLQQMEEEQEKFKRELEKVERAKAAREADLRAMATRTKAVEGQWVDTQVKHMSTAFLQRLRKLTRDELAWRCDGIRLVLF